MRQCFFLLLAVVILSGCAAVGRLSEKIANNAYDARAPLVCAVGDPCPELPDDLWIADLHADTLLWQRDIKENLSRDRSFGHVDVAKLREGRASLQILSVVTHTPLPRTPSGLAPWEEPRDLCAARDALDTQVLLKVQELYQNPLRLFSIRKRAMWQIKRFHDWVEDSESGLNLVSSIRALDDTGSTPGIGAMLAIEGLNWVHGTPKHIRAEIERLARLNVRMASLTHRFTNALAESSEDCALFRVFGTDRGLSAQGRTATDAMIENGIVVDLAHSSPQTISAVTAVLGEMVDDGVVPRGRLRPVVSHGGVYDVCESARNLTQESIRDIVMADGVIGVGFWKEALCFDNSDLYSIYRRFALSLMAIADAVGSDEFHRAFEARWGRPLDPVDHVALGSDFDGAVKMYFDVSGVPDLLSYMTRITCEDLTIGTNEKLGRRLAMTCSAPTGGKGPLLPLSIDQGDSPKIGSLFRLAGGNVRSLLRAAFDGK